MGSKPITARAAAKVYANSVAKENGTPAAGTLVNVGGQASKAGAPKIESYYTGGSEVLIKGAGGKSMRQAYDDALKLGWREEDESFEDYKKRAEKDPNYGKGGTPDKIESTPGYTTTITSQEATPIEETRDTYKPWEQRQAARAQKVAGRLYRQAERRFSKGRITEAERDAAKARLDAATGAAMAGRNVMRSTTYTAPKSGKGLQEFDGGPRINVTLDPVSLTADPSNLRQTTPGGREKVFVADTGLASSTPDAFRQMRGVNPLEEKQSGISKKTAKSPIYKMGGYGSKTYKN